MTTYPLVVQIIDEIAQTSSLSFSLFLIILGAYRRLFSSSDLVRQKIPLFR